MAKKYQPPLILMMTMTTFLWWKITTVEGGNIGITWGRQSSHKMVPSMVTDLLLQNGIAHIKIFSSEVRAMKAFAGTRISVTVTMSNGELSLIRLPALNKYWLNQIARSYRNKNINITGVHLGNYVYEPDNATNYEYAVGSLKYIQDAIIANDHNYLTASIVHSVSMLNPITKPSEAEFNPFYKDKVMLFLKTVNGTRSQFAVSISPFEFLNKNNLDVEFAFMDNQSNYTVDDNGVIYTNAFELIYDSFVTALAKLGAPKELEIVVYQIGWPTDAHPLATVANAERFYRGLLPHIKNDVGTPLRPGASIDIHIMNLADENTNPISIGGYERHWGIYKSNGEPKFKMDFSGHGRDIYPTVARGLTLMPKRWCVFNGNKSNMTKVREQFDLACQQADCTALYPGGSCSQLSFDQNVSYAFNNYFQMSAQYSAEGSACDFHGLSQVVPRDPSVGNCEFQLEILAADLKDLGGLMSSSESHRSS